jgi:5-hydroxyisourate hydrolase
MSQKIIPSLNKTHISSHILDTTAGHPAAGVKIILKSADSLVHASNTVWTTIDTQITNADGRAVFSFAITPGHYQLEFFVADYLKQKHKEAFYSVIPVSFVIEDTHRNYHVPLLISPYGYSTYRGS